MTDWNNHIPVELMPNTAKNPVRKICAPLELGILLTDTFSVK